MMVVCDAEWGTDHREGAEQAGQRIGDRVSREHGLAGSPGNEATGDGRVVAKSCSVRVAMAGYP
jgi:hypothetical protein